MRPKSGVGFRHHTRYTTLQKIENNPFRLHITSIHRSKEAPLEGIGGAEWRMVNTGGSMLTCLAVVHRQDLLRAPSVAPAC